MPDSNVYRFGCPVHVYRSVEVDATKIADYLGQIIVEHTAGTFAGAIEQQHDTTIGADDCSSCFSILKSEGAGMRPCVIKLRARTLCCRPRQDT